MQRVQGEGGAIELWFGPVNRIDCETDIKRERRTILGDPEDQMFMLAKTVK